MSGSIGGRFAEASGEDIAAFREAVEPVYGQLRSDADTATLIAEIEALKAAVSVESLAIPEECAGSAAASEAVEIDAGDDPSVLDGSYQLEWTAEELMARACPTR